MKYRSAFSALLVAVLLTACEGLERLQLGIAENAVFEVDFDWQPYESEDGAFAVDFPVAPHTEEREVPGGIEHRLTVYYTLDRDGLGGMLRLTYIDIDPVEGANMNPADNYDAIADQLASQFEILSNETAELDGYEIRVLIYGEPATQTFLILTENRLYMIHAGVDETSARFLDSFRIQ
jgi:hypothetical protein